MQFQRPSPAQTGKTRYVFPAETMQNVRQGALQCWAMMAKKLIFRETMLEIVLPGQIQTCVTKKHEINKEDHS